MIKSIMLIFILIISIQSVSADLQTNAFTIFLNHFEDNLNSEVGSNPTAYNGYTFKNSYNSSLGKAISFNRSLAQGLDSMINYNTNNPFSLEFVLYLNKTNVVQYLSSDGFGSTGVGVVIIDTDNKVKMVEHGIGYSTGYNITNHSWYHVALTFDSSTLKLYLDNLTTYDHTNPTLVDSWINTFSDSSKTFSISGLRGDYHDANYDCDCIIDEYAFYNDFITDFPELFDTIPTVINENYSIIVQTETELLKVNNGSILKRLNIMNISKVKFKNNNVLVSSKNIFYIVNFTNFTVNKKFVLTDNIMNFKTSDTNFIVNTLSNVYLLSDVEIQYKIIMLEKVINIYGKDSIYEGE